MEVVLDAAGQAPPPVEAPGVSEAAEPATAPPERPAPDAAQAAAPASPLRKAAAPASYDDLDHFKEPGNEAIMMIAPTTACGSASTPEGGEQASSSQEVVPKRRRVACKNCNERKLRCSKAAGGDTPFDKPCSNCVERGLRCDERPQGARRWCP